LMGNDTVFTLKATPGAEGGMVASTGANATDVDEQGWIYNTEMGGLFPIPEVMLSEGERILLRDRTDGSGVKLEDLISGRWLPRVFEGFILALNQHGIEELDGLTRLLKERNSDHHSFFSGQDLCRYLKNTSEPCPKLHALGLGATTPVLKNVAKLVVRRAGKLAGLMGYICLHHPLSRKHDVILSLDSTQALHLEGYFGEMQRTLSELAGREKRVKVVLQRPCGAVTVPMKGLAAALLEELLFIQTPRGRGF